MSERLNQPEWIDLGKDYYTDAEYRDCLLQLDRIGRLLGGDQATFWALRKLRTSPQTILDVGCGGGLFTIRLAKSYPQVTVLGTDISQEAIQFAREQLTRHHPRLQNIEFQVPPTVELNLNQSYDVVMATLVCHHLSDSDLIEFLKRSCHVSNQAVILNDLHRHPIASFGFRMIAPVFFRNRIIQHDGLLSIDRAFTRQDWEDYLKAAGIDKKYVTITWHWPFRWIVFIDTAKMKGNQK